MDTGLKLSETDDPRGEGEGIAGRAEGDGWRKVRGILRSEPGAGVSGPVSVPVGTMVGLSLGIGVRFDPFGAFRGFGAVAAGGFGALFRHDTSRRLSGFPDFGLGHGAGQSAIGTMIRKGIRGWKGGKCQ